MPTRNLCIQYINDWGYYQTNKAVRLTPKTTTTPLLKRINSLIILTDYSRLWRTCVFYVNYRAKVG